MDNQKTGILITKIRKNKNMTQKEVADLLNVSDKTISKWERGLGSPDISLLNNLAEVLGVNVTEILSGEMILNDNDGGNMKKTKFYVCPICHNIITSTNELILTCCGQKLEVLIPKMDIDESHAPSIEVIEDEIFVHVNHEMKKDHYISYIAYLTCDKLFLLKLYPEQNAEVRFKKYGHGTLFLFCNQHGLWGKRI